MDEKRREQIRRIVDNFNGKQVTPELLTAYCERMKVDPITVGQLEDYTYQVNHDNKVQVLLPLILEKVSGLRYKAEFASEKERTAVHEGNDEIRIEITKLLEQHEVPYHLVDTLTKDLAQLIGLTVEQAGTTATNKASGILLHLAKEHFGTKELNMKHVADYAQKIYDEADKKKGKEKSDQK